MKHKILLLSIIIIASINILLVANLYSIKTKPQDQNTSTNVLPAVAESPQKVEPATITLMFGGDVMLGRSVMTKSIEKNDSSYPFRKIYQTLENADITFVNLENPVIENCPLHTGGFIFCSSPESLEGLVLSGVDIVNLANNHTLNHGKAGFEETKKLLTEQNIEYTGAENLEIITAGDTIFGFLGFDKSQLGAPKLTQNESDLVSESDVKVDILIVAMHWGVEYQNKALDGVRELAKELVALGVDVIVGHHPHWVQDYEKIDGVPVYYSLGNLVFDQMWSEETKEGMLVKVTFQNGKVINEEFLETYMAEWAQPVIVEE